MPKLSKIRLTGCRYDGLKKEHENSIFDLTKNEKPDHTLFTLCNGGGKGVMMQLIFQLLLPETRWGKNNGNKVISMFYDQRNNLNPFTFHVVLEWILDTVPEKRLITGIAVKAVLKNSLGEEEGKAGLSYFLYTHEHDGRGFYTVDNLPLYDQKSNEATDIEVLDDFISTNRRDFIKYSQTSAKRKDSDYFRYLETRGIYRSEWINLKDINKLEGGAGDYFTGASDNKSIFDKIIIPAISENIKNYSYDDKDNLIEMFRSNLSITKDLPVLIKREGDYRELLSEIKPLIENADIGSRLIDHRDTMINEGNDLFFILNGETLSVDREIEKWEREIKNAFIEKSELEYRKDNLLYNQYKKDLELTENQIENLGVILKDKVTYLETKKEEQLLYQINDIKHKKICTEKDIEAKNTEKNRIMESLELSDIIEKAKDLDNEIEIEWEKIKSVWINTENQYSAFNNYNSNLKKENEDKIKKYKEKIDALKDGINRFTIKEEEHEKQRCKLEETYDAMSMAFPERIKEDLLKIHAELEEKIKNTDADLISLNKIKSEQEFEDVRLKHFLDSCSEKLEKLIIKINKQEKYELEVAGNISRLLLENPEGGILNDIWLDRKKEQLNNLRIGKTHSLESLQKMIWGKNIDRLLNREDYFIPNKDVILIKEEIQKVGINVQTGAEYLYEADESDKTELIMSNPGFLYSLVIGNLRDWDILEKNIRKDLFINNMVPVFIRSEMKMKGDLNYRIIRNDADKLTDREFFSAWKHDMETEIESLIQSEYRLKKDLEHINNALRSIETLKNTDTVFSMNKILNEEKKNIAETEEKLRLLQEKISEVKNKIIFTDSERSDDFLCIQSNKSELMLIESYIEKKLEIEAERIKIAELKKDKSELEKDIEYLRDENSAVSENLELVRASYFDWKLETGSMLESLKEVYKAAKYDYKANSGYSNNKLPDFEVSDKNILLLVNQRKIINKDISEKNIEIAVLDVELKNLDKELLRHLSDLYNLSEDWNSYEYFELPPDEVAIIINNITKSIDKAVYERDKIKSDMDILSGSVKIMKQQLSDKEAEILKIHRRSPVFLEILDVSSEIDLVERDLKSNNSYSTVCSETLERNKTEKTKLEINLTKIKSGYTLDLSKGKANLQLKDKVIKNPDISVDEWLRRCEINKRDFQKTIENGENIRTRFVKSVDSKLQEDNLREKIVSAVKEANISNFKSNYSSFSSMEEHFQKEILRLTNDKSKAESLMKQWTDRASMHVIRMIEGLKNMVSSMNYINEQGHAFPLVKLKGIERLPKDKNEILYLLDEYFLQSISNILERYKDISSLDDKELKDIMGDRVIFSKALQGRYPTLMVYKMSEKNEFRYARARDEYYTTWEAINKGEGDLPEGSGGQTLSVNTFVIMMIMSFKKKYIGNENPSTVLILDNPFGKASAKHVLDPIFEIADKLNFQLICFAAPEIIKVEISERFPVFWELKIDEGKIVHGGRVIKR